MNKDEINRKCSVCGGYTMDDGTSELCWCDEDEELDDMFSEALSLTEKAIGQTPTPAKEGGSPTTTKLNGESNG